MYCACAVLYVLHTLYCMYIPHMYILYMYILYMYLERVAVVQLQVEVRTESEVLLHLLTERVQDASLHVPTHLRGEGRGGEGRGGEGRGGEGRGGEGRGGEGDREYGIEEGVYTCIVTHCYYKLGFILHSTL